MSLPAAASARTVPTRWVPWRRVGLRLSGWTRLLGARPAAAGEPGAALFRQLRLRLSLWYVAVLALALVVTGTAVYLVLQIKLLEAPNALIRNQAAFHAQAWGQGQIGACAANTPGPPALVTIINRGPLGRGWRASTSVM